MRATEASRKAPRPCLKLGAALALLVAGLSLPAQESQTAKPVPVVTGYSGFNVALEPGEQEMEPIFTLIFLVPLGERFLVEAEFEFEGKFEREDGQWGPKMLEKEIEYLQVDYFAHRYATIVAGRFLTPVGIFNERLHPIWIKNLQPTPIIFGLEHGSSNGLMVRGGAELRPNVNLNYTGYFSALTTTKKLESERSAGGRWSVFFLNQRLEAGASFLRKLGDERFNLYGFDATWTLPGQPLDLRTEYIRGAPGSGYWVEGAYGLSGLLRWNGFFRRVQVVVRVEQFFAPGAGHDGHGKEIGHEVEEAKQGEEEHLGAVPEADTERVWLGWNYYLRGGLKLSFAYGRNFSGEGDHNLWSLGIAYRFAF